MRRSPWTRPPGSASVPPRIVSVPPRAFAFSAIALSADHVDGAERRDEVRDHAAFDHLLERRGQCPARRPDPDLPRLTTARRDYVKAELAVRAFDVRVRLAYGHLDPVDDDLEVVHQLFDRGVNLVLLGEH